MSSSIQSISNSWLAIGLSLLAGLCTALGGCIVYFKQLVKLANKTFLSGALGFSAGVMLFLSFYEILGEGVHHFSNTGISEKLALFYGCLSLFIGILIAWLLELILHKSTSVNFELPPSIESDIQHSVHDKKVSSSVVKPEEKDVEMQSSKDQSDKSTEASKLKEVGILTAIAIALHNIPEGIVTYIGYVDNPVIGITIAIGIAAHNIPEGLSVALPVFYATNSRGKAFIWSLLSGLAEPLGALLCMLFLQHFVNDYIFGFLFGFTGGVMTYICVYELIPTGMHLETKKNYTTLGFLCGMGFIMISLILLC